MTRPVDRLWNGRRLILLAGDAVIFAAVVTMVFSVREPGLVRLNTAMPFIPVFCFSVIAAYAAGLYELRLIREFVTLIAGILGSSVACAVFATTYFYLLLPYLGFSPKITLLLLVAGTHAGMLVWRRVVLFATAFTLGDLSILILGDKDYCAGLRRSLGGRAGEDFNLVETVSEHPDLVVVDYRWAERDAQNAQRVLSQAVARRIPVVSITEFHESLFGKVSPEHAVDVAWAVEHVLPRSGSLYFTVKRVLDAAAGALLLVFFAPLLILVAITIAAVDRHSPLYGQRRTGYLGRTFVLWKFRTMRTDAEHQGPFIQCVEGADVRVTRLGKFLRRHRIDELPQLWNVLKGDMSLVGPRPEWVREVEVLERKLPTYGLRYLVPPGLTGWAQVYYRATNNPQDAVEKHNYDLYYLKHFSLALDFSILLKTIKRVMLSDSAVLTSPALEAVAPTSDVRLDIASIVRRN